MAKQQEMIKTPLNGNLYSQVLKYGFGALIAIILLSYFIWHMERQSVSQNKMTDSIIESNNKNALTNENNSKTFKEILEEQKRTTDANKEIIILQKDISTEVGKNGDGINRLNGEFSKAYNLMEDVPRLRQEQIDLLKKLVDQKENK